jgi:phage terminase large subunit GpA-like protein
MMLDERAELLSLEADLREVSSGAALADAAQIWRQQGDALKPADDVSTQWVAVEKRYIQADGGAKVRYRHDLTPHLEGVHDACDDPTKRIVAIQGPARSGKTIAWENFLLKVGMYGPSRNMGWYMHSEPDVKRYVRERVDWFLREHGDLWQKRDKAKVPAWNLRTVDGNLWEWLAANDSTTRARSFSLAIADEIDAMRPHIRDAIITLLRNRQREYGSLAKILVSSHPDAGPLFGIASIIKDSDRRLRMAPCPSCNAWVGAAVEVEAAHPGRRLTWNVPLLMKRHSGLDRDDLLNMLVDEVRLICPACEHPVTNEQRLAMRFDAEWVGRGQEIDQRERIIGDLIPHETAGFIFHAVDAPFDSLAQLARPWAAAFLKFKETGKDADLKEQTVKSLGEIYQKEAPGSKPAQWKQVRAKLVDTGYVMGTVPRGVDFLTCFVDVQGDRFEPGVIGWSRLGESWLVDRFSQRQMEGFHDIRPGERLSDWQILEFLLRQSYPLNDGSGLHLPIAKLGVDTGGVPGVTENARRWFANLTGVGGLDGQLVPSWRLSLQKGDAHIKGEFLGPVREIKKDKADREYPTPVYERTVNVTEIKKLIAYRRDEVETPGPLFMHLPGDVTDAQVRELCAETLVGDQWFASGRNELWDIWVGCEVLNQQLNPEDSKINWSKPPPWARPFKPSPDGSGGGMAPVVGQADLMERLRQFNRRRR